MKLLRPTIVVCICAFNLSIGLFDTHASTINLSGQLKFIELDNGGGVYSGVPIGTEFYGTIDDVAAIGSISDGVTLTSFGCCIAAGGLSISNDRVLSADDATFLNGIIGSPKYSAGDLVDGINLEGDTTTLSGGRIEIGLSYILDPNIFPNTDLNSYSIDPNDIELALFFIFEEDASGIDIYSSGGRINPLAQEKTYFPHIASNSTWETDICIINTSTQQSHSGNLKAYNNSGQLVSSTSLTLDPNARWEITIGDYFPNPAIIGYLIFESDSPNICGYTKFYVEGKYRVAVPAVSGVNSGDVYISHIASNANWWTGISLLNTSSSSKALTIEFDNGTTKTKTIAAKEHQMFTVKSLFGGATQPNIKSAVIKNGIGIVGLELFGSTGNTGNNYMSGVLLSGSTTTRIYYPHIASNSTWWTGLVAYNPSSTACNLTITPYTADGISLSSQILPLNGQEQYMGTARALNFPAGTAWFKITSTSPITGFELFGTTDGNQMGGYTGVGISGTDGVFAKIEKNGGWTGIAFVNIENSSATVTMIAYNDSGNIIATGKIDLSAYEKVVSVASNLFSQNISSATCIAYSSTGNVVGFQLNGSSDDMMLDALPGV